MNSFRKYRKKIFVKYFVVKCRNRNLHPGIQEDFGLFPIQFKVLVVKILTT